MDPKASVILTSYNRPALLSLALHAYGRQSCLNFELLIADPGSGEAVQSLVKRHAREAPFRIVHVPQPDEGLPRSEAINRAVLESRGAHLIIAEGHCLPARSFVEEHLAAARPGTYTVGGHVRLSPERTDGLTPTMVRTGEFERRGKAIDRFAHWTTHVRSLAYGAVRTPRRVRFYGLNLSVDRATLFRVNGFDHAYPDSGPGDWDLRDRMQLAGVRPRNLWNRACLFHLHEPGQSSRAGWRQTGDYRRRSDLKPEAPEGLRELAAQGTLERSRDLFLRSPGRGPFSSP
jgi:glycosyltransferase involved in cell wall biosynthesis